MKVNYDYYTGKDEYCDGDVEKSIISYLEKYGEENADEIFSKDMRWPVFYHITPIRKNILKWYPIEKEAEVLEIGAGMGAITGILCDKAKYVTSVELSKQRASSIITRCKDRENLEIIVGNFNDIKFDKKFDYITLIGVLEYASLYTNSKTPYIDFLKYIKSLLKPKGKLLIAIENQFGLKYFAGSPEDHTGKVFDGILGYENKKGIRTFGKNELTSILEESGFKYSKFYYPYPDYKLPSQIFSSEYLPTKKDIDKYLPYLSNEYTFEVFNEKEALNDIIKNNQFEFFANSFFVEASISDNISKIDLSKQDLYKISDISKKFFETHYGIININEELQKRESEIRRLKNENQELKEELHKMATSKSWRITKPLRDLTSFKLKK